MPDVIVIGAGPAGAIAAFRQKRRRSWAPVNLPALPIRIHFGSALCNRENNGESAYPDE